MSVTFISYRPGDADYTTHTLHTLEGASQSGQTQVVEVITINGVTYAMVIDANTSSTNGLNGWTPVLALHVDGDRTLARVTDWTGGGGTKPAAGMFLGASGFVADMAQAISVRGPKGDAGDIAQLADGSIGKAKLSNGVQASLNKADAAISDLAGVVTAVANGPADKLAELQGLVSGVGTRGSGLPFVMPSSGTINNTSGRVTVTTGFDYVIGPSYSYFPAAALSASSPAGWYYTEWTSATIGQIYADTYTSGAPAIPASPAALVTVAAAYTQATGFDIAGPNYVITGGSMGANGLIEWGRAVNNNNSAGAKVYNTYFGGTSFQGLSQTTNPREAGMGTLRNRGRVTAQIGVNAAHGDNSNASALPRLAIDTSANQIFSMSIQLAVATDYAIIEGHHVRVTRVA